MNGGGSSRVSIPGSERKIVQDIKEIAQDHSDEEIYAMLKECNMDPNETVQKLLFQDTFHEVKRKRERRKENLIGRETYDTLWRTGMQGRGSRGGRGGYYSKYQSHDTGGTNPAKEVEPTPMAEKGAHVTVTPHETVSQSEVPAFGSEVVIKESLNSSESAVPEMPRGGISLAEVNSLVDSTNCSPANVTGRASIQSPSNVMGPASVGPISDDTLKSEVGIKETAEVHPISIGLSSESGKVSTKSQGQELNYLSSAVSKPSSNSGSRLQQVIGPQKAVGPNMEWKPKSTNQISAQVSAATTSPDLSRAIVETEGSRNSKEKSISGVQKKLEELHLAESQHVIIPDHLQVPESQRSGLSFGSFDSSFAFGNWSTLANGSIERSSVPLTGSSQGHNEDVGSTPSNQNVSSSVVDESTKEAENLPSNEANIPMEDPATSDHEQLKGTSILANESSQISALHTPPLYSAFGLIPPVLGGQFAPFEGSEAQTRESSAVASFIPFDPSANYYAQIYQTGTDGDGRFAPYLALAETKYNGNTTALSSQNSQPAPEPASSPTLPTTGIASAATLPASITQQPLSPYRQPAGIPMPQYPPNYMPYAHYFSPFYVPTPIHPFFSNPSFSQQPLPSTLYPPAATAPPAAATAKYSQYKSNTGSGYPSLSSNGPYSSGQPSYNDDPSSTQYKETNVYITGQQSEGGGAVWIPNPGRDLSGSFYNLSPGQPVNAFGGLYHPTQSLGGAAVHPMIQSPLTVSSGSEMAAPPVGVYQQPQRTQMNWAGNY